MGPSHLDADAGFWKSEATEDMKGIETKRARVTERKQRAPATTEKCTVKVSGGNGSNRLNFINDRVRCWWAWWRWWGAQWACPGGRCPGGCPCHGGEACAAPAARWGRWTRSPDPGRCLRSCSCCRSVRRSWERSHGSESERGKREKRAEKRQKGNEHRRGIKQRNAAKAETGTQQTDAGKQSMQEELASRINQVKEIH